MILPDVNVLLYAYDAQSEFNAFASKWLETVMNHEQVLLSWHTITAFLRISTNPKVWSSPMTLEQSIAVVGSWLERENVHLIALEKRNWALFTKLLKQGKATGNLVMDAHIAAIAASFGATIASTDRDFMRFAGVDVIDPIGS